MEGCQDQKTIIIKRKHLAQVCVDENTRWRDSGGVLEGFKKKVKQCTDCKYLRKRLIAFFPVVPHLMNYQWRSWLLNDVIAGVSCTALHIPQGLGLAMLAGVPPVYGLYTSFIPGWIYYIFGSSRHLSIGTTAVASLMVGSYVNSFNYLATSNGSIANRNDTSMLLGTDGLNNSGGLFNRRTGATVENDRTRGGSEEFMKVNAACLLTMATGIVQLIMYLCNFYRMSYYMSIPFVKSFIAGCAAHIIINQLPFQLGISIHRTTGHFQLPFTIYSVFKALPTTNISSLIMTIICMVFLFLMRFVTSTETMKKLKVPLPVDLFLVVVSILVSHFCQLKSRFGIKTVGSFSSGFPSFHVPSLRHLPITNPPSDFPELMYDLIFAAIALAIVDYVFNITMAKLMAERNDYEVDADQEIMAYGLYNSISSFFSCHVSAQSPPRTLILETCKSNSQLASLISTIAPLIVAVFAGSLVASLPICVLGSIISASLIPLFILECINVRRIWKISRRDFVVWVVCCLSTVFIGLIAGLLLGMLVNGWMVLVGKRDAEWILLERFEETELFKEKIKKETYDKVIKNNVSVKCDSNNNEPNVVDSNKKHTDNSALIMRFSSSLVYTNSSIFKDSLLQIVKSHFLITSYGNEGTADQSLNDQKLLTSQKSVILDFSCVSDIDITGLNTLRSCVGELEKMEIIVMVCSCPAKTKKKLHVYDLYDLKKSYFDGGEIFLGNVHLFPSIIDAYTCMEVSML